MDSRTPAAPSDEADSAILPPEPGYPERVLSIAYEAALNAPGQAEVRRYIEANRDALLAAFGSDTDEQASHAGLRLVLRADPNFDFGPGTVQRTVRIAPRWVPVPDLRSASEQARRYIVDNQLGGGNFTGGDVYRDGKPFARVSFNGSVFDAATGKKMPDSSLGEHVPSLEILSTVTLTQAGTIEGWGGTTYQLTEVQLGTAKGWVREGLRGDTFGMTANERVAINRGTAISNKLEQVLYVAADKAGVAGQPSDWALLVRAVQLSERGAASASGKAPRRVIGHPRFNVKAAEEMKARAGQENFVGHSDVLMQVWRFTVNEDETYQAAQIRLGDADGYIRLGIRPGDTDIYLAADGKSWDRIAAALRTRENDDRSAAGLPPRPVKRDDLRWPYSYAQLAMEEAWTKLNPKERRKPAPSRRTKASTAVPPMRLLNWPLPRGPNKIPSLFESQVKKQIEGLSSSDRADHILPDAASLTRSKLEPLLSQASKKSVGSVVEVIRKVRRERPDLDPGLKAAIEVEGVLTANMKALKMGSGVEMGLGLLRVTVINVLLAARFLIAMGEL